MAGHTTKASVPDRPHPHLNISDGHDLPILGEGIALYYIEPVMKMCSGVFPHNFLQLSFFLIKHIWPPPPVDVFALRSSLVEPFHFIKIGLYAGFGLLRLLCIYLFALYPLP